MPGCDGSAAPFVDALLRARIVGQGVPSQRLDILETIRVGDDRSWIEAQPAEDRQLHLEYHLDYPQSESIGRQVARTTVTREKFCRDIASSRTFLLESEARQLVDEGLGRRVTPRDLLVFNDLGPIDNRLRYPNECARHKALDVLGDLALAGCRIGGRIVAYRSGHRMHAELTRQLVERFAAAPLRATA
jgi:UDP-3-O-acyl-N-acetylglucosamine deacetylase